MAIIHRSGIQFVAMLSVLISTFLPQRSAYVTWEAFNGTPLNTSVQTLRGDFSGGWSVKWRPTFASNGSYEGYGQFSIADVDGDGHNELVGNYNEYVVVLNGTTGALEWQFRRSMPVIRSLAVGDINGDSANEVITDDDRLGPRQVVALRGVDGTVLWRTDVDGIMYSSPKIGDIDGDGVAEVVIGTDAGTVYVLNGNDGSIDCTFSTGGAVRSTAALANDRIVIGSFDSTVYVLDGTCNLVWSYRTGGRVWSSPVLVDINGDTVRDVIVGSGDGYVYALNGSTGTLLWAYNLGCEVRSAPALANIDWDGDLEVVAGDTCGHLVSLRAIDGTADWSTTLSYGIYPYGAIGLADLLPSSYGIEILVLTETSSAYSHNYTFLLASDGSVIRTFPNYGDGFALGDADDDGCTEVYLECDGCSDGKDVLYDSSTNDSSCGVLGEGGDLPANEAAHVRMDEGEGATYDVSGRRVSGGKGIRFIREGGRWRKVLH